MMNDEFAAIAGKHEQLVGTLQEKYGIAKEETKRQVDEFKKIVEQLQKSNGKLMKFQKSPGKRMKLNRKPVDAKRASKKGQNQTKVSVRF
jgi:DNA-binding protein H-NS